MKILVTGFEPFGKEKTNPSYEAAKELPDRILASQIIKMEIPTSFSRTIIALEEAIEKIRPHVVINIGQAGGRASIDIERVAINLAHAKIPDNDGYQPIDEKIQEDGENAYFASLPVRDMVEAIKAQGIPANISYSAGTYVCNTTMYNMLYLCQKKYPHIKAGFIHVPYSLDQAINKPEGTPSMPIEIISRGIQYGIEAIVGEAR